MSQKFSALQQNGTWTLVPFQSHMNLLPNKWVFKIKRKYDGSIKLYKARLVANGFHQKEGVDYTETFSPVVKRSTIRLVFELGSHKEMASATIRCSKCILHGFLAEEVNIYAITCRFH